MSDSKRETEAHWSFVDGVNSPLGRLADACLDAFEETGNAMLQEAANALRAIETVDLNGCNKVKYGSPLPWHSSNQGDYSDIDEPILDDNGDAVVKTESGCYPPELKVCESIVECMNTVYALQTK